MKKSRFSEEQIIGCLKQADAGLRAAVVPGPARSVRSRLILKPTTVLQRG